MNFTPPHEVLSASALSHINQDLGTWESQHGHWQGLGGRNSAHVISRHRQ